jgi:TIR domain
MAGKIFINYRRDLDAGTAGRLCDHLVRSFQPDQIFMDIDGIPAGLDFAVSLQERLGQCDVLLAVISKNWIDVRDGSGARRLDRPDDFVRLEIEFALEHGKRLIPVLVGGAQLPRAEQLPKSMQALTRMQAVPLMHERFSSDTRSLIEKLQQKLKEAEAEELLEAMRGLAKNSTLAIATVRFGGSQDPSKTGYTAASQAANDLLGVDLEDGQGRRLVGCTTERLLSAMEKRMSPAQWRAFARDQERARRTLVASVPIVYENHEDDAWNRRAFMPFVYSVGLEADGSQYVLVLYLEVTMATIKEIGEDGEEYYVCRLANTSNVRLEPLEDAGPTMTG